MRGSGESVDQQRDKATASDGKKRGKQPPELRVPRQIPLRIDDRHELLHAEPGDCMLDVTETILQLSLQAHAGQQSDEGEADKKNEHGNLEHKFAARRVQERKDARRHNGVYVREG